MPIAIIITAAGSSSRMGCGIKKEYLALKNGTVLSEATKPFLLALDVAYLIITYPFQKERVAKAALFSDPTIKDALKNTALLFVEGDKDRESSVFKALLALEKEGFSGSVFIHDGARAFISEDVIQGVYNAVKKYGAACPFLEPVDTQKEIDDSGSIIRHLQRKNLAAVQTPQAFDFQSLLQAHKKAHLDGKTYTDDTEIWDAYVLDRKVKCVKGSSANIKITYPSDIEIKREKKMIHTGLGYDLHPLAEGRKLVLGGVAIPFDKGEAGHSDGDVLLHAITDSLLGASGLGDIGSYFPPSEPKWKDSDSRELLKTVWKDIKNAGWQLINLDAVILLEQPKFLPYRNEVIQSIASILEVDASQIFVKAKTGEKMGKIGNGEAIEAFSTCLLEKL